MNADRETYFKKYRTANLEQVLQIITDSVDTGIPTIRGTQSVLRAAMKSGFKHAPSPRYDTPAGWLRTLAEQASRAADALDAELGKSPFACDCGHDEQYKNGCRDTGCRGHARTCAVWGALR